MKEREGCINEDATLSLCMSCGELLLHHDLFGCTVAHADCDQGTVIIFEYTPKPSLWCKNIPAIQSEFFD